MISIHIENTSLTYIQSVYMDLNFADRWKIAEFLIPTNYTESAPDNSIVSCVIDTNNNILSCMIFKKNANNVSILALNTINNFEVFSYVFNGAILYSILNLPVKVHISKNTLIPLEWFVDLGFGKPKLVKQTNTISLEYNYSLYKTKPLDKYSTLTKIYELLPSIDKRSKSRSFTPEYGPYNTPISPALSNMNKLEFANLYHRLSLLPQSEPYVSPINLVPTKFDEGKLSPDSLVFRSINNLKISKDLKKQLIDDYKKSAKFNKSLINLSSKKSPQRKGSKFGNKEY